MSSSLALKQKTRTVAELDRSELVRWCAAHGEPAYRADQVRRWVFRKRADSFEQMHNLPSKLRRELGEEFTFFASEAAAHRVAADRTEKLLLRLHDGQYVECVLMREARRRTVCISTQVGCGMGCVFCASGLLGLKRNLSRSEILEQILRADRLLNSRERLTNVVVMGIGEPLANLEALLPALQALSDEGGLGLSARRITISTVGLPEKIRELAALGRPYNLAVSLHAPNDRLRNRLVPVNQRIGIRSILDAADEYFQKTGRRVTYEYVLLGGINDKPEHARQLGELLRTRNAHVNLIPLNDVTELPYRDPSRPQTRRFVKLLKRAGAGATCRKRKGADIEAACGQLRLQHAQ